jgi:2,3-bisphosphoglycerate-dependent phosphoglycerate mutase
MARLIFVRHSIPAVDPATPATEWTLSAEGISAAQTLAARLPALAAVVSSDEPKAAQTAQLIAAYHRLPFALDADLREHVRASAGFLPRDVFADSIASVFANPHEVVFGDESADQLFARMQAAVERADRGAGNVVLVTHGTALTTYVSRTTGLEPMPFWTSLTMPMALSIEAGRVIPL